MSLSALYQFFNFIIYGILHYRKSKNGMNDVLFIPLPGESVHYGPSELLFCLDSSYNISVHVQLSQLRLSYSKKPKQTNDDVTIIDQSVELFKNIRNHIPINSIIKLEVRLWWKRNLKIQKTIFRHVQNEVEIFKSFISPNRTKIFLKFQKQIQSFHSRERIQAYAIIFKHLQSYETVDLLLYKAK